MAELSITEKKEILPFALSFLEHAHQDLRDIKERFFMLGCRLYEAQCFNYVEALGYENIEALADKEFDLGRTQTYNLINVFKRFCDRDENGYKAWIDPRYKNYDYSKLVEMEKLYCLPYNVEKEIPPKTPVRVIRQYVKYFNKNPGDHKCLSDWWFEEQQRLLPAVQTSEQTESRLEMNVSEMTDITEDVNITVAEKGEKEVTALSVQTSGLTVEKLITKKDFENLYRECCDMFDLRSHVYTTDKLWLRCVPEAFADMFFPYLVKHFESKLNGIRSAEKR